MRVVSYNIRHARGMDGRTSSARIARVLGELQPDVVALQEVWRILPLLDQARRIARTLGMDAAFQVNVRKPFYRQGNAVLVRGRLLSEENLRLPGEDEPRGALVTRLDVNGIEFRFVSTHLSLRRAGRSRAVEQLASLPTDLPLVLAGDMNCAAEDLSPLETILTVPRPPATFPSTDPVVAIDHIAHSHHWRSVGLEAVPTLASDHLPLVADLEPAF